MMDDSSQPRTMSTVNYASYIIKHKKCVFLQVFLVLKGCLLYLFIHNMMSYDLQVVPLVLLQ